MAKLCDKCRQMVPKTNSVLELEYERHMEAFGPAIAFQFALFQQFDRHLFPTSDCKGSPSRAQYLGGPDDPRYPKRPESVEFGQSLVRAWGRVNNPEREER